MKRKLTLRQILVVASTLFGMIFGAGNLIFPVHMGQLAGNEVLPATIGFMITAVGIPILSIISIGYSESNGLFELAGKVSKKFGYFFATILYFAIGPCFVMPRSASISFDVGLATFVNNDFEYQLWFFIFNIVFFGIVALFSLKPSRITTIIGKIINPVFLVFLFCLMIVALLNPIANIMEIDPDPKFATAPFFNGFSQGYGAMDALAGLVFGIILINIVKDMGIKNVKGITKNVVIASVMTGLLMITIYLMTIIMGVESRGIFETSSNGSIALSQISKHYFGMSGLLILTIIVSLGGLKTSIGLVTSCSVAFKDMYPKSLSQNKWAWVCVIVSFVIANFGLDNILDITQPFLFFLYPLAIVLIILAFTGRLFNYSSTVFKWTIGLTCIPAIFDFFAHLPIWIVDALGIQWLCNLGEAIFPFMSIGFSWVFPAIIGFLIGIIRYKFKMSKKVSHV